MIKSLRSRIGNRCIETLEWRYCLASVSLIPSVVVTNEIVAPTEVAVADFNGDGMSDVFAMSGDRRLVLFPGSANAIERFSRGITAVHKVNPNTNVIVAGDIDGDGDEDVVTAHNAFRRTIVWHENLGGGSFSETAQVVTDDYLLRGGGVIVADLDNDGDGDVISGSAVDRKAVWFENIDGEFSAAKIIAEDAGPSFRFGIDAIDFDDDGDVDVALTFGSEKKIWLYENDGTGRFAQSIITDDVRFAGRIRWIDLDRDNDADLLFSDQSAAGEVGWLENVGGAFSQPAILYDEPAYSALTIDVDQDRDLDIVLGLNADNQPAVWLENVNGLFGSPIATSIDNAGRLFQGDLDGDGYDDLLRTHSAISWYANESPPSSFGAERIIAAAPAFALTDAAAADLDGDGDNDLVSVSAGKLSWYEQIESKRFSSQKVVSNESFLYVDAGDVNGDGQVDLLAISDNGYTAELSWFENLGGGSFGARELLVDNAGFNIRELRVIGVNGDQNEDILLTTFGRRDPLSWLEFDQESGAFFLKAAERPNPNDLDTFNGIRPANIDNDEFADFVVLKGRNGSFQVTWFEHFPDRDTIEELFEVSDRTLDSEFTPLATSDIDGDGDDDVLIAGPRELTWFENTDGLGTFGASHQIDRYDLTAGFGMRLDVADIDNNGAPDVVLTRDDEIVWYPNEDGGFGASRRIASETSDVRTLTSVDIDGDGDSEVMTAVYSTGTLTWYQSRATGDSNDDGRFNSTDLVGVFITGEYEDDILNNSTFDDGDWNGDGEFDSSDLVFALQSGTYSNAVAVVSRSNMMLIAAAISAPRSQCQAPSEEREWAYWVGVGWWLPARNFEPGLIDRLDAADGRPLIVDQA